jgi:S-adenosylmethionine/arginine decarboxylase-like enzyme
MSLLVIVGAVRKDPTLLQDVDRLCDWTLELCRDIGMHPVGEPHVQPYAHWDPISPSITLDIEPPPAGVTVIQHLKESGIRIDTYPEKDFVEITLHSCNAIPNPMGIVAKVIEQVGLDLRGWEHLAWVNWRDRVDHAYQPWLWPKEIRDAMAGVTA